MRQEVGPLVLDAMRRGRETWERQVELAHEAGHVFDQVRRCGDDLARECFATFLFAAAGGAGRLAQAAAGPWALVSLEASYQRVRRASRKKARAFFWRLLNGIVSE